MGIKLFSDKDGVLKTLDDIQALFGKDGEYWIKGAYKDSRAERNDETGEWEEIFTVCLSGAAREVDGPFELAAYAAITQAIYEREGVSNYSLLRDENEFIAAVLYDSDFDEDDVPKLVEEYGSGDVIDHNGDDKITSWNDRSKTTWSDVVAVLNRARDIVRES